jgi:uncharacterized protein
MSNAASIQSARPVIAVEGRDQAALTAGLVNLLIVENATGLYRCEALFGNWDASAGYLFLDRRLLDFGKAFKVKLNADDRSTIFEGRMMGIEAVFPEGSAPRTLCVLAEDRLQDLRMTRRTRTFSDVSDADVFRRIANDHSLTPELDVNGTTHKLVAQVNQSDLAFVRERARAIDAEVWVSNNTLFVKSHTARGRDSLQLRYPSQALRAFSVMADLAQQRTSVAATGWDVAGKQMLKQEATEQSLRSELGNDEGGASILRARIGERKECLAHTVPLTSDEARAEAESYFKLGARRFVVGRGVAQTDERLRVGNRVEIDGVGTLFNGKYAFSEVRHRFDGAGLRTEFVAERAGIGRPG